MYYRKKKVLSILLTLSASTAAVCLFLYLRYGSYVKSLSTLKKVDDYPMYTMTYYGDYRFEKILEKRPSINKLEMYLMRLLGTLTTGYYDTGSECSSFAAYNEKGERIYGRNLDLPGEHGGLLLYCFPKGKYASVSMVDLDSLGYKKADEFKGSFLKPLKNRMRLLWAPLVPKDGMNEWGLTVSTLNAPLDDPNARPEKGWIGNNNVTRLLLDNARDVDEAIRLFHRYGIYQKTGTHYLIADSSGHSAVVEFAFGKLRITHPKEPWQVATNFMLYGWDGKNRLVHGQERYFRAFHMLKAKNGRISEMKAMDILSRVSQESTIWSSLYNMTSGDIYISIGRDYESIKNFKLKLKQ